MVARNSVTAPPRPPSATHKHRRGIEGDVAQPAGEFGQGDVHRASDVSRHELARFSHVDEQRPGPCFRRCSFGRRQQIDGPQPCFPLTVCCRAQIGGRSPGLRESRHSCRRKIGRKRPLVRHAPETKSPSPGRAPCYTFSRLRSHVAASGRGLQGRNRAPRGCQVRGRFPRDRHRNRRRHHCRGGWCQSLPSLTANITSCTIPEFETRHRHGARCEPTPIITTLFARENSELSTVIGR